MSSPKKSVIATLSATALVATIGYAFAQSSDDTALANSNWNGGQNSADNTVNGPPAMPTSAVSAYNAEISAADTMAGQPAATTTTTTSSTSTDYSSSSSSTSSTAAPDSTSPWSADASKGAMTDPNVANPNAANPTAGTSPDKTDITHPAVAPQADTGTNASMTTNTTTTAAPAAAPQTETRIDLNSPDEPLYNLPSGSRHRHAQNSNSTGGAADNGTGTSTERAPRADRN